MVPAVGLISKISGNMDKFSADSASDSGGILEADEV